MLSGAVYYEIWSMPAIYEEATELRWPSLAYDSILSLQFIKLLPEFSFKYKLITVFAASL